jgi:hypothetical protein
MAVLADQRLEPILKFGGIIRREAVQQLQALQLKKRAACRSLFSECAHASPTLRHT